MLLAVPRPCGTGEVGLAALDCCVATRHLVLQHGATACGTAQQVATSPPSAHKQSSSPIPTPRRIQLAGWDGTCCMSEFAWPRLRCCCCAAEATDMSCAAATLVHRRTTHALRVPIHNVSPTGNGRAFSDTASTGRLGRAFSDTASTGRLGRIISASSAHYWKILHEAIACLRPSAVFSGAASAAAGNHSDGFRKRDPSENMSCTHSRTRSLAHWSAMMRQLSYTPQRPNG